MGGKGAGWVQKEELRGPACGLEKLQKKIHHLS
jgi:hypothetical protein